MKEFEKKGSIELVLTNSSLTIWKSVTTIVVISNDQNNTRCGVSKDIKQSVTQAKISEHVSWQYI